MKKCILLCMAFCLSAPLFAASIIVYEDKKDGESEFIVINSKHVALIKYEEVDKEFIIFLNQGPSSSSYEFTVDTVEKSQEIVKRLFDETDTALIELKYN